MNPETVRAHIREGAEIARDVMLRDQFAMMAMQGMLARPKSAPKFVPGVVEKSYEHYAIAAYDMADAMLEARS